MLRNNLLVRLQKEDFSHLSIHEGTFGPSEYRVQVRAVSLSHMNTHTHEHTHTHDSHLILLPLKGIVRQIMKSAAQGITSGSLV